MRQWLIVGAAALLLVSCTGDDDGVSSSVSTTTPASAGASGVYVVQQAGAASLTAAADGDGSAELLLTEAPAQSVTFVGGADPRARTAPTAEVVDVLNAGDTPHEAALTWSSPTAAGALVVTVEGGTYDEAAATLQYRVRVLDPADARSPAVTAKVGTNPATQGPATTLAGLGTALPDDVTASTLFIDPLDQDQAVANCNLTVTNESAFAGQVDSISPSDRGGMADWDRPLTANQPLASGESITAASGDSTWDCHAQVTFGFTSADGDWYGVYLKLDDPVFSRTSWSCEGPPELSCTVTANDRGQPMDMTVVIAD